MINNTYKRDDSRGNQTSRPTLSVEARSNEEKEEERRGFERNGFNQYVSDRLPLDREVPETRDERFEVNAYKLNTLCTLTN